MKFALDVLSRGLKTKEELNDDDPATRFIKLNQQLKDAIIDEYTKEGVEHHKLREAQEIEERFQKKETTETLETLISLQADIKGTCSLVLFVLSLTRCGRSFELYERIYKDKQVENQPRRPRHSSHKTWKGGREPE